jgi:hypothetical protein
MTNNPKLRLAIQQEERITVCASSENDLGYIPLVAPDSDQDCKRNQESSIWSAHTAGLLASIRSAVLQLCRALFARCRPFPLGREILRECYSLPRRIGMIRATKMYLYGVRFGRLQENQRHRHSNERTLACIRDTQRITQSRPWATLMDRHLFVEGWQSGVEWPWPV